MKFYTGLSCLFAYFFPRQFLGPTLKACKASSLFPISAASLALCRNRSGLNSQGSTQLSSQ